MWEQIRSNRRKSVFLVVLMAFLLMTLGLVLGEVFMPRGGGFIGIGIAMAIWIIMSLVSYFQGGNILLAVSGAHKIDKTDHPQLYNVVEEMHIAAGMSKMPDVYIMEDPSPNAFATGRNPEHSAVAVTTGLLSRLNRDQLQGVIAHEISHVVNRDVLFMTMVGVMVGAIVMLSHVFLRGMIYGGRGRSRSSGGGQLQIIMLVVGIVMAILAPILARLIYLAASRRREYLADANAVVLTRYPDGLAGALEAIASDPRELARASKATAPMYIANPFDKMSAVGKGWFSTHPPIPERVRILRGLTGTASFKEYQRSWEAVGGASAGALPASALAAVGAVPLREAAPDAAAEPKPRRRYREATDVARKKQGFKLIPCSCGVKIKLPPRYKGKRIRCPRCRTVHSVSDAR